MYPVKSGVLHEVINFSLCPNVYELRVCARMYFICVCMYLCVRAHVHFICVCMCLCVRACAFYVVCMCLCVRVQRALICIGDLYFMQDELNGKRYFSYKHNCVHAFACMFKVGFK